MSTRSDIIVERADGTFARIYCHFDGYLSHHGPLLLEHYNSQELAEALVAPGDMSVLAEEVGEKHPFDAPEMFTAIGSKVSKAYEAYKAKYGKMNLYYGRDRGEEGTEPALFDDLGSADNLNGYTYVWKSGAWYIVEEDITKLQLLAVAIEADRKANPKDYE